MKATRIIIGLIMFLITIATASAALPTPSLNLTFNDGTIHNTTFAQNTGTGLNFTISNANNFSTGGKNGGYYYCGGNAGGYSDYFRTTSSDSVNETLSAWFKTSTTSTGVLVAHYDATNGKRGESLEISGNNIKVLVSSDGNALAKNYVSSGLDTTIGDGSWHMISATIAGNTTWLYLDGINVTTITKTTDVTMSTIWNSTYNVTFCMRGTGGYFGNNITGNIDELLIFNKTLNSTEILGLYNSYTNNQTEYYFSQSGDDVTGSGNITNPYKTITKLNTISLLPNTEIYFKSNDTWRSPEDAFINIDDMPNNITITSYGSGERPKIFGSTLLNSSSNWTCSGNICNTTSTFSKQVGNIIFTNTNTTATNKSDSYAGLDVQGEFYYNTTTGLVSMYSPAGNPYTIYGPAEFSMQQGSGGTGGIFFGRYMRGLTLSNLDIRYSGQHGIDIRYSDNITVKNNFFDFNGGCFQTGTLRFGNDIQVYGNNSNWNITNNTFLRAYDTAVAIQQATAEGFAGFYNISVTYNTVDCTGYSGIDYFSSYASSITDNILIDHNTVLRSGYCNWGYSQRSDLYGIGGRWDRTNAQTTNFIITNNIFDNNTYRAVALGINGDTYWKGDVSSNYNLYNNDVTGYLISWNGSDYYNFSSFRSGTGANQEANGQEANPNFYYGTYQPISSSPACNMSSTGSYVGALPCTQLSNPNLPFSNLVLYYSMDNSTTSNNWLFDTSGSRKNARNNNVTLNRTGVLNDAVYFNRSGSFANTTNYTRYTLDNLNVSVSVWVKFNSTQDVNIIYQDPRTFRKYAWVIDVSGQKLRFCVWQQSQGNVYCATYNETVIPNSWYYVMGTYNVTHNSIDTTIYSNMSLYINGSLVSSNISEPTIYWASINSDGMLGLAGSYNGTDLFNGSIDEVSIWNTTLTSSQANATYQYYVNGVNPLQNYTTYNNSAPTVTLNLPNNNSNVSQNVTFNWTATDIESLTLNCTLNVNGVNYIGLISASGTYNNYTAQLTSTGINLWNVTCVDEQGLTNYSQTRAVNYSIIGTPNLTYSFADKENLYTNVSMNCTDAGMSTIQYLLYVNNNLRINTTSANASIQWNKTLMNNGNNSVNFSCNTGYTETNVSLNYERNHTTPHVSAYSVTNNLNTIFNMSVNCTDDQFTNLNYSIIVNGNQIANTQLANNSQIWNTTTFQNGNNIINFSCSNPYETEYVIATQFLYVTVPELNYTITKINETQLNFSYTCFDSEHTTLNYSANVNGVQEISGSYANGTTVMNTSTYSSGNNTVNMSCSNTLFTNTTVVNYYSGILNVTVYDETTNSLITQNLSIILSQGALINTYYTTSGGYVITNLADGVYEIRISNANYSERVYYVSTNGQSTTNLIARLVLNTITGNYDFYAKGYDKNPINNATITVQRSYGSSFVTVAQCQSNILGLCQLNLVNLQQYQFVVGGAGLTTINTPFTISPSINNSVIYLSTTGTNPYTNTYYGILFSITPRDNLIMLNNSYLREFNLTTYSSSGRLQWTAVTYGNTTNNITGSPSGGTASISLNFSNVNPSAYFDVVYSFKTITNDEPFYIVYHYYVYNGTFYPSTLTSAVDAIGGDFSMPWKAIAATLAIILTCGVMFTVTGSTGAALIGGLGSMIFFAAVAWLSPIYVGLMVVLLLLTFFITGRSSG